MRLMRACSGSRIHIYLKSHAFFFVASVALCEISGNCEINADNTCIYSIISCLSYTSIFQTIFLKNPLGINRFGLGIGSQCHLKQLDIDQWFLPPEDINYSRKLWKSVILRTFHVDFRWWKCWSENSIWIKILIQSRARASAMSFWIHSWQTFLSRSTKFIVMLGLVGLRK